jgi:alpha-galactosidase
MSITALGVPIEVEADIDGDGRLSVEADPLNPLSVLVTISLEGEAAFTINRVLVTLDLPLAEVKRVYTPRSPVSILGQVERVVLNWRIEEEVGAARDVPLLAALDRSGRSVFAAAFVDQRIETRLSSEFRLADRVVRWRMERPIGTGTIRTRSHHEQLLVTRAHLDTTALGRHLAMIHDEQRQIRLPPLPEEAMLPMYCSWYPWENRIDHDLIVRQGRAAHELGIVGFIIDAGWYCGDGRDEWDPGRTCGDWTPHPDKFPDLRATVEELREMGLAPILWCAPFAVGGESEARADLAPLLSVDESGAVSHHLCPRCEGTRLHLESLIRRLVADYALDGLKLDFIDDVPLACHGDHDHAYGTYGEGMDACLAAMRAAAELVHPGALIEFRQSYANIGNRRHANLYRQIDCPTDMDQNRRLGVQVRGTAVGVAPVVDPVFWAPGTGIDDVRRYVAGAVLMGVPMFSLDLAGLPEAEREALAAWLGWYRGHRERLLSGEMTRLTTDPLCSSILIQAAEVVYVGLFGHPPGQFAVPGGTRELHIVNGTFGTSLLTRVTGLGGSFRCSVCDVHLRPARVFSASAGPGGLVVDTEAPVGGMVILERE